jgi:hypothetical protein
VNQIEFIRDPQGCWNVEPALHPRTGFTIIFPSLILIGLAIFGVVTRWGQPVLIEMWKGLGAMAAVWIAVNSFALWDNRGHAIRWDNDAVYIRQLHPDWGRVRWARDSWFARIPFESIERIKRLGFPRGVPPRFHEFEVVLKKSAKVRNRHFVIDPNYFKRASLMLFIDDLQKFSPQVGAGANEKDLNSLIHQLIRSTQTPQSPDQRRRFHLP